MISLSKIRGPVVVLAGLLALGTAYTLGRQGRTPLSGGPAAHTETEHGHQEEGAEAEEGLVHFDAKALELAGLTIEAVALRSLAAPLALTGTVEPNLGGVVRITPRVGGKLLTVSGNVGDTINAGQVVATVSSTELATAQAAYRQAVARVNLTHHQLRRQRQLAGLGEFGRHKVEEARQLEINAHGEVNAATNDLARARNEVAEARSEQAALEGEVAGAEEEVVSGDSEIREAESATRSLEAALVQAQSQVRVTESRFKRLDSLLKDELVSRQDWEQSRSDFERAEADVSAARADLARGQAAIQTARAHRAAAQAQVRVARSRVKQAEAKIETSLSRQAEAEARLVTARKRDTVAEETLAREERVYRGGFLTTREIQEAQAAVTLAEAEREAAAETVTLLGGRPGGGAVVAVRAPIGGRITERQATLGETVDATRPLFTLINLKSVWVQFSVPPKDLLYVREGQPVTFTTDAAPGRMFRGTVSYLGDAVDPTTRMVPLRAVIPNTGGLLRAQSFVRGTLSTPSRRRVIAVPREAVQTFEGKQVVFVAEDHPGEFRAVEVVPGESLDGQVVIQSGLQPGVRVVTRGAFTVKAQAMKAELGHEH